jgi:hypothetical protein
VQRQVLGELLVCGSLLLLSHDSELLGRGTDVDLAHDEIRHVVQVQRLDFLVLELGLVFFGQKPGERGESERRGTRNT